MSLRVRFGSYIHDAGEVAITINRDAVRSESESAYELTETWTLNGWLNADSQSELLTKKRNLESAYAVENRDAFLLFSDNSIAHEMRTAQATGGVKIVQPVSFPQGRGAEWATYRSYQITLQATFPIGNAEARLLSWTETLSITGTGGPRGVLIEILNGPPQPQTVMQRTICRAVQSGSAVGYSYYPSPPPPIFPQWEFVDQRTITRTAPRARNTGSARRDTDWKVDWTYVFEAPYGLGAYPHLKPRS